MRYLCPQGRAAGMFGWAMFVPRMGDCMVGSTPPVGAERPLKETRFETSNLHTDR